MTEFTGYFLNGCIVALMVAGPLALWVPWRGYKRTVAVQEAERQNTPGASPMDTSRINRNCGRTLIGEQGNAILDEDALEAMLAAGRILAGFASVRTDRPMADAFRFVDPRVLPAGWINLRQPRSQVCEKP